MDKILYAEDKCLAEAPIILRVEECISDSSYVDINGDSCDVYVENKELCGV